MVLLAPSQPPRAQPNPPPCCTAVYFTPTTKSDILPLTDSILHCCTNFTFYRFNSRQSLFPPAAPFSLEIPGDSRGRFKFLPFYIQLPSLKAKGMQGVNLVECCQTLFSWIHTFWKRDTVKWFLSVKLGLFEILFVKTRKSTSWQVGPIVQIGFLVTQNKAQPHSLGVRI